MDSTSNFTIDAKSLTINVKIHFYSFMNSGILLGKCSNPVLYYDVPTNSVGTPENRDEWSPKSSLLSVHRDFKIDFEEVIKIFSNTSKKNKINLTSFFDI